MQRSLTDSFLYENQARYTYPGSQSQPNRFQKPTDVTRLIEKKRAKIL